MEIPTLTGYTTIDVLLIIFVTFAYYSGLFKPTVAEMHQFSGGVFIYKDYVVDKGRKL